MRIELLLGSSAGVGAGWLAEWTAEAGPALGAELRVVPVAEERLAAAAAEAEAEGDALLVAPGTVTPELAAALAALERPLALVDLADADRSPPLPAEAAALPAVRGRGIDGFRWAAQWLEQRLAHPPETRPYGVLPDRLADLRLPEARDPPHRVAVLLHGGFWRERWLRDTIEPLAVDLVRRGYASWNVEYRRAGPSGGGWPATCADVAAAIDALAGDPRLDPARVVLVGHSAGAQLAAWAVHRRGLASIPALRPAAVVSLAGVLDLTECARRGLGDTGNPVVAFMGATPDEEPERYAAASPLAALPLGVPQLVVQGRSDSPDFVDMNRSYVEAARAAGDEVAYLEPAGADHFALITPASAAWQQTAAAIERLVPPA